MATTIYRGKAPIHKIRLEGWRGHSDKPQPNPALEIESSVFGGTLKLKIGESEVEIDGETLLKAIATLTPAAGSMTFVFKK